MGEILTWIRGQAVGFLGGFFGQMNNMGAELFELPWVADIVLFFSYLAWALYLVGLVVAVFEYAIGQQTGKSNIRDLALHAIQGFMAAALFSITPVELYKLAVSLQVGLTTALTGYGDSIGSLSTRVLDNLQNGGGTAGSAGAMNPLMVLFLIVMMGYAVIKVFFANLKRGGILLIQIAVGSLYLFSVSRGINEGFIGWCRQIVGLCLTTFLQTTMLVAGLMVLGTNLLLGWGLMLAAGEVPRIAATFGVDTSAKVSVSNIVHNTQTVIGTAHWQGRWQNDET